MIYDYASMLFAGAKKTGKSFTARCIAYHLKDRVYDATVFTGSEEVDHPWQQYVPDSFVHDDYDESILSAAMLRQKDRIHISEKYHTPDPGHLVVFEDLEYKQHNIFYEESCRQILLNGRHNRTYPMVLVQYIMKGLTREIRGMFDFVFLQKEPDIAVRRKLWTVFGGCCETFGQFDSIFRSCTDEYGTMVIALRANSYAIVDNLFWFKAHDMGQFRIGHPDVWRFHRENYSCDNKYAIAKSTPITSLCDEWTCDTRCAAPAATVAAAANVHTEHATTKNRSDQEQPSTQGDIVRKGYINGGGGAWLLLVDE